MDDAARPALVGRIRVREAIEEALGALSELAGSDVRSRVELTRAV